MKAKGPGKEAPPQREKSKASKKGGRSLTLGSNGNQRPIPQKALGLETQSSPETIMEGKPFPKTSGRMGPRKFPNPTSVKTWKKGVSQFPGQLWNFREIWLPRLKEAVNLNALLNNLGMEKSSKKNWVLKPTYPGPP